MCAPTVHGLHSIGESVKYTWTPCIGLGDVIYYMDSKGGILLKNLTAVKEFNFLYTFHVIVCI